MLSPLKFINVMHTVNNFNFENHSQLKKDKKDLP